MSKAAAKRELDGFLRLYSKPWDVIPPAHQEEIARLTKIVYPNGIPLPRI